MTRFCTNWLTLAVLMPLAVYAGPIEVNALSSPSNNLHILIGSIDGRPCCTIAEVHAQMLPGLTVDGVDLFHRAKFVGKPEIRDIDETYDILGNHPTARNRAREAIYTLSANGTALKLIVRVYDDGMAVRFSLPDGAKRIDGESTAWTLPENVRKVVWSEFSPCYEALTHATRLDKVPEGKTIMAPVTVQLPHHYLVLSEADNENFPDMALVRNGRTLTADLWASRKGWEIKRRADENRPGVVDGTYRGMKVTPWRYTIVAKDLNGVVNSDMVTNLCPPPAKGSDFSWVKPGRCLWQWWSVGAPRYENQKNWYDAAAKLKWEYYLIDDGWRTWRRPGRDQWELLKEVIAYGKTKGVKSIVWVDSKEMRNAAGRRAYLERVKACGADGIKIDFIPNATADITQWYIGGMQDCAELKLLLNFHGSVKPTGLRRTYPCDITREAVRGDEWHMTRYRRVMPLSQDVTLPFARPLAGPADITPVMMDPKELQSSHFTWPHEFAQAIVFLSPVTHFADQYKFYVGSPLEDLFQEVPSCWDETRVLPLSEIGEVVGYARRKGDAWWVGVLNGATAREVRIPLDFLAKPARGTLVFDHSTTDAAVDRREQNVKPGEVLSVKLRPAGGFVARLRP